MSRTSLGARPAHPGTRLQAFLAVPLTSDLGTILTAFRASKVLLSFALPQSVHVALKISHFQTRLAKILVSIFASVLVRDAGELPCRLPLVSRSGWTH